MSSRPEQNRGLLADCHRARDGGRLEGLGSGGIVDARQASSTIAKASGGDVASTREGGVAWVSGKSARWPYSLAVALAGGARLVRRPRDVDA